MPINTCVALWALVARILAAVKHAFDVRKSRSSRGKSMTCGDTESSRLEPHQQQPLELLSWTLHPSRELQARDSNLQQSQTREAQSGSPLRSREPRPRDTTPRRGQPHEPQWVHRLQDTHQVGQQHDHHHCRLRSQPEPQPQTCTKPIAAPGPRSAMENWPVKTREMHTAHINSEAWNDFEFRDDDIIVASWAKSGTTWVQQILTQLIFDGKEGINVATISPWLDLRYVNRKLTHDMLTAQSHRRVIKTHLPVDALVFSPRAKYVYVARDGRDTLMSMHNHHMQANDEWYRALNDTPGLVGPKMPRPNPDVPAYFDDWLANDGYPWWPFWENIRSWWNVRHLPNVLLIHYADLKADMRGQIRRLADYIGIEITAQTRWDDIVHHCTFEYMREHAELTVPRGGKIFVEGPKAFLHRGRNGSWKGVLSAEQTRAYQERAVAELGAECATWLETGGPLP